MSIKKIKANTTNKPVLMKGTRIDTRIAPAISFLFLNSFIIRPATIPAIVVFRIHVIIVPTGLTEKKKEIVLGAKTVKTPETSPKNPPTTGPYNIAPMVIIIKLKFKFVKEPTKT